MAATQLPYASNLPAWIVPFQEELLQNTRVLNLQNRSARRQGLTAPLLLRLARHLNLRLSIEDSYLLEGASPLFVVAANHADISRDFSQLAAELIALEQWTDSNTNTLYGAVSFGNLWQFAVLSRDTKHITQDLGQYRSPEDITDIFQILLGILNGNQA
ncbi:hypothetical protein [Armatimonas sp.]|uniref:hypothetical protein n=1 Tax=Armatimonas sp. TaxID=1872638 RepID=UPI00374CE198